MKPKLTYADYSKAAKLLNVDVPTIRAVTAVESSGAGFLPDGRIIIRFEPHIFSRYSKGEFDLTHPELSYRSWKSGYPTTVSHSYQLFEKAAKLNGHAAGLSCSYGLFQIMGFNYSTCGCKTFKEFYFRMAESEAEQLLLFCAYVDINGLDDELRRRDWASFALQYNGKQFKRNKYDINLENAYRRYQALK